MSGIVGSRLNTRGSGVVGSLGTDGQILASAGAGKSAVFETISVGGDLSFGGDTFGANKIIGSNDSNTLSFETNNTTAMTINTDGSINRDCPKCNNGLLNLKLGKFGSFIACSN